MTDENLGFASLLAQAMERNRRDLEERLAKAEAERDEACAEVERLKSERDSKNRAIDDCFDEINALFGRPEWEYPGQVVRDVRQALRERDEARAEAVLAKSLHDVAVSQRDGANYLLRETERERDELRAKIEGQGVGLTALSILLGNPEDGLIEAAKRQVEELEGWRLSHASGLRHGVHTEETRALADELGLRDGKHTASSVATHAVREIRRLRSGVSIERNHLDTLVIAAVRYALGRRSYIVSETCDLVRAYVKQASEDVVQVIAKDIQMDLQRAEAIGTTVGDPCDDKEWRKLLKDLDQ
jgi:hypothetical protein